MDPEAPSIDDERPRRRRFGQPPRLYVLAPQSRQPWVQVTRLGSTDGSRLARHILKLRQHAPAETVLAMQLAEALDFSRTISFAAVARGEIVATAIGIDLSPGGLGAGVTVLPAWRGRQLRRLLAGQVLEAADQGTPLPHPLALVMAGTLRRLGGRIVPPERLGADWLCQPEERLEATA